MRFSINPKNSFTTYILALVVMMCIFSVQGQHSTYYLQKASHFASLPAPGGIVFIGNSITDGGEWQELFPNVKVANRGISGDQSQGILDRLDNAIKGKPRKLFLMIGINDLAAGIAADTIVKNIWSIVERVHDDSPYTQIYVQSLLPVNNTFGKFGGHVNKTESIQAINSTLRASAEEKGFTFINFYPEFLDKKGKLDALYTNDGLHLTGEGYLLWKHLIYPYVYGLKKKPALIPAPKEVEWHNGKFPLYKAEFISISEPSLRPLAEKLRSRFSAHKPSIRIKAEQNSEALGIHLKLSENTKYGEEGYVLEVTPTEILLSASTRQGIFYGLQTLFQLMRDGTFVPACSIFDKPAFQWRGMMHDLGRNYIPMAELKKHIDAMARYKLNVLHLHLTEDIAWRLGLEQYPELTAASNMKRNPGMYYTMAELKELINYCKERFITLVPEIDMPGHSGAFRRAFGVSMQSEKGKEILKNIVHTVAAELDVPYFHLGGDEVKITDTTFLPEMSRIIRSYDKKVIGWLPGGNLDNKTVRQLWASVPNPEKEVPLIDSRYLYLNHIDPFAGIVKIFNNEILGVSKGDSLNLGGEICIWADRRPSNSEQVMLMNAVYPAMITFAERSWQGGGFPEYGVVLGKEGSEQLRAFREFEKRLINHKKQYFVGKSFPYVRQDMAHWRLSPPYDNHGNLTASFPPETEKGFWKDNEVQNVIGSTIWLRHFWADLVPWKAGYIQDPKENSTVYAYTEIYAPEAKKVKMWISFHNPSRSENDATAPAGEWGYRKSRIWLNGKKIAPPNWSKPGRKVNNEVPYIDESFEIRPPHTVALKKGWNKILLKLPVGEFSIPQTRLVKWMFTVAIIEKINGQWRNARGIEYRLSKNNYRK
ncbi:MAG TPA: family 20 glycosylhydrolase [Salinimicrobium sp.]|nr:family 20 glycosylhydrolase [Salinimicrobium sp.]